MESGHMRIEAYNDLQRAGMDKAIAAGMLDGDEVRVLVSLPGFSLTHAWFKKGYPLPLHSHDSDCLYYIVSGSLRLGTQDLGSRDSFFVPAGVPYRYSVGASGVEVLEIRHETNFNFVNLAKGAAFWDKAAAACESLREEWALAVPPSRKV
jgi:mannose-6-phosphate isomerase-like protein (cupin superfamily)